MSDKSFRSFLGTDGADIEYAWLMIGIVGIPTIGFLTSIFPTVEFVITLLLICAGVAAIIVGIAHIRKERRLDWEAFYGPLPIEKDKETP
jgi:hypothetical protein